VVARALCIRTHTERDVCTESLCIFRHLSGRGRIN